MLPLALSGCLAATIVGGTAATAGAIQDERSLGTQLDDNTIASKINVRLIAEEDLPSRWISANVVRGHVLLTGYLPKQEQVNRAIYICRHIKGVKSVQSDIRLASPKTSQLIDDAGLETDIKRKLFNDKEISGFTVHVSAIEGKVYLLGVVANAMQRQRAATLAAEVPGVKRIVNMLHIKGSQ